MALAWLLGSNRIPQFNERQQLDNICTSVGASNITPVAVAPGRKEDTNTNPYESILQSLVELLEQGDFQTTDEDARTEMVELLDKANALLSETEEDET